MYTMMNDWKTQVSLYLEKSAKPLIVVLGPTASGKTSFSIELAHYLGNAEVLNADSRQLYRGMDIGTAKVTQEEIQGVPHHLLDVFDPNEEATAGWYKQEASLMIDSLHASGKIPLLVGGSMLYLSTIIDDLSLAPVTDAVLRERITQEYEMDSGLTLYKRLQSLDPDSALVVDYRNQPHLVRAVEICELTGSTKAHAVQSAPSSEILILGVNRPREELVQRINERVIVMFAAGWVDEVRALIAKGYGPENPAMKSHGYKEIMQWIADGESGSLEDLQESIAAKGRQYAKRQMTWWRGDARIHWLP